MTPPISRTGSHRARLLGLAVLLLSASAPAHAQRFGQVERTESNIEAYYYHVQPGQATIDVHVMGTVMNPGLYTVGADTDLRALLALSGGPLLEVRDRARARRVTLRLFRAGQGDEPVFEADLSEGALARPTSTPDLRQGDVLTVEVVERQRFTFRDVLTVANTLALIALTVERFANAGR